MAEMKFFHFYLNLMKNHFFQKFFFEDISIVSFGLKMLKKIKMTQGISILNFYLQKIHLNRISMVMMSVSSNILQISKNRTTNNPTPKLKNNFNKNG